MAQKTLDAWWFAADDTLTHGDGRKVVIGKPLSVKGRIVPCKNGLHASVDPYDALQYAPGPILYKVRLSGTIRSHGEDKYAATTRTALARRNATEMLRTFARRQAFSVAHLWDVPAVVREYLETGDENLRAAAYAAARAATDAAARAATDAAADAATRAAARAAADAARAAAEASRGAGDREAAHAAADAARAAIYAATHAATYTDAADTAADDATDAAYAMFNEMVNQLFEEPV